GYALETAARILNIVLTKKVDKTPYEILHGKAPKLSYLRVWGCEALVKRDTPDKLDSRHIKCIFLGYPKETIGYYFYCPLENKIFVSQNVEFFENSFMVQEASGSHGLLEMSRSDKGLEIIQEEDTQPSENTSKEHNEVAPIEVEPQNVRVPIRRSARIPQVPDRYGYYVDIEEYELGDLDEPPNYKAALADPESDKWLEAMNTEMQSMKDNQVWYLVDLPSNGRTVGCKWLFKKKTDMDGNVHTFKARLVAKGFTQTYRVDYGETFSLVADIRAIKILLAIIASKTSQQGEAAYILRIKIIRDRSMWLIGLSQSAYLEKILKKFRMENSKKRYTSMMEKPDYRKSRFQQNPSEIHLTAVKTILKYMRNTKDMVFVYGAKPEDDLKVSCYTDAKAEYIAAAEASMEAARIRKFIDGLGGVMPSNKRPMEMLCDNEPTLAISTLMAYSSSSSDSEVSNNSNCLKSCLKTVETLKSQYDQLHKDFKKSELMVLAYKTGLESVEEKLEVYKANESIYSQDIKVLKFEIECKDIAIRELRKKLEIA
ncbi:retrotransposon protein, putative, ty1-copia subclass, partial [Tanacetum coccineum]